LSFGTDDVVGVDDPAPATLPEPEATAPPITIPPAELGPATALPATGSGGGDIAPAGVERTSPGKPGTPGMGMGIRKPGVPGGMPGVVGTLPAPAPAPAKGAYIGVGGTAPRALGMVGGKKDALGGPDVGHMLVEVALSGVPGCELGVGSGMPRLLLCLGCIGQAVLVDMWPI